MINFPKTSKKFLLRRTLRWTLGASHPKSCPTINIPTIPEIFGGPTAPGGVHLPRRAKNWKRGGGGSRRGRRREKFLSTFLEIWKILITIFEIFGKFVNKNAIKSDFWGIAGRYISKISKKIPVFGRKIHPATSKNFEIHLPKCRPPPHIPAPFIITRPILRIWPQISPFLGGPPKIFGILFTWFLFIAFHYELYDKFGNLEF